MEITKILNQEISDLENQKEYLIKSFSERERLIKKFGKRFKKNKLFQKVIRLPYEKVNGEIKYTILEPYLIGHFNNEVPIIEYKLTPFWKSIETKKRTWIGVIPNDQKSGVNDTKLEIIKFDMAIALLNEFIDYCKKVLYNTTKEVVLYKEYDIVFKSEFVEEIIEEKKEQKTKRTQSQLQIIPKIVPSKSILAYTQLLAKIDRLEYFKNKARNVNEASELAIKIKKLKDKIATFDRSCDIE